MQLNKIEREYYEEYLPGLLQQQLLQQQHLMSSAVSVPMPTSEGQSYKHQQAPQQMHTGLGRDPQTVDVSGMQQGRLHAAGSQAVPGQSVAGISQQQSVMSSQLQPQIGSGLNVPGVMPQMQSDPFVQPKPQMSHGTGQHTVQQQRGSAVSMDVAGPGIIGQGYPMSHDRLMPPSAFQATQQQPAPMSTSAQFEGEDTYGLQQTAKQLLGFDQS